MKAQDTLKCLQHYPVSLQLASFRLTQVFDFISADSPAVWTLDVLELGK
jgi:hypothetical protein